MSSPHVSGFHAEFILAGEALFIRDLDSSNGTYVNGVRLEGECPVGDGDRIQFANMEFVLESITPKRAVPDFKGTIRLRDAKSKWVFSRFAELMGHGIFPSFQPIVDLKTNSFAGFEALARSSVRGLERPDLLFDMAKQLNQEQELSIKCRERALMAYHFAKQTLPLFLNTHPAESFTEHVIPTLRNLRRKEPILPITIEIHEGAARNVDSIAEFFEALSELDIALAYDDFGAGQARMVALVAVPPAYVKLDMSLMRNIDTAPVGQRTMVKGLIETAKAVGTKTIAEGIETVSALETCRELGIDMVQGYIFGRPSPQIMSECKIHA